MTLKQRKYTGKKAYPQGESFFSQFSYSQIKL